MEFIIGSSYFETRERLREKIRIGNDLEIKLKHPNKPYICYFCLSPIKGNVWVLKEELEEDIEARYYLDDKCYKNSKRFVYYRGMPFSLS